jgi:hypothetical protein
MKMLKKSKISVAAVAVLLLGRLAVNIVMGATPSANTSANAAVKNASIIISAEQAEDIEQLKALVPKTLDEAESAIYPARNRFLMWTYDGAHIMWGIYGNGRFVGTDNLGKRCWGIYGKGIFAGFYDGEFFWGKYHTGTWKAQYFFGLRYSRGRYVLFPSPLLTAAHP